MIFDKLAGVAERQRPEMVSVLQRCRLFEFAGRAHEVLPRQLDESRVEQFQDSFFLPYSQVFLEDSASGVLLGDMEDRQQGLAGERFFLVAIPLLQSSDEYAPQGSNAASRASEETRRDFYSRVAGGAVPKDVYSMSPDRVEAARKVLPKDMHLIVAGVFSVPTIKASGMSVSLRVANALVGNKHGIEPWRDLVSSAMRRQLQSLRPGEPVSSELLSEAVEAEHDAFSKEVISHVSTAIEQVMYFNTPDRFVLETQRVSKKQRPRKASKGRIPRSDERPVYTLLHPSEIRRVMGIGDPASDQSGRKVRPHERRRHFRTYTSERYKSARGTTVVIPATWIGPDQASVGNKRYRVCLDI
jgi:hypothetical protein